MKFYYTYRISNTHLKKHYYGSRGTKIDPYKDLGIKYFSSSKDRYFIKDQNDNPSHYKYKIIKIFYNRIDAILLEIKLHNKFNVDKNESFYNKAKQTSSKFSYDATGTKRPKHSERMKGQNNPFYGNKHTAETLNKIKSIDRSKSGEKITKSRLVIQQSGKTLQEEITAKRMLKMTIPLENGETLYQKAGRKGRETRKLRGSSKGENCTFARNIIIYNNENIIVHKFKGNFKEFCKVYNLPYKLLEKSIKKDERILSKERKSDISQYIKIFGMEYYLAHKGWYAKIAQSN